MQRLIARFKSPNAVKSLDRKAQAPVPLSPKELKEVAGGLPRIGGLAVTSASTGPTSWS